jgi:hypothetical protein
VNFTTGTGNIILSGAVGGVTSLNAIQINSVNHLTANNMTAASLIQLAGTGLTTLNGDLNTTGMIGISGTNLQVNAIANTVFGNITIDLSGTGNIASNGAFIASNGTVNVSHGTVYASGQITGGSGINLFNLSSLTLSGCVTGTLDLMDSSSANITGQISDLVTTHNTSFFTSNGVLKEGLVIAGGSARFTGGTVNRTGNRSAIVTQSGSLSAHNTTIHGSTGATANTPTIYISGGNVDLGNAAFAGNNTFTLGNGTRYLIFNNATANASAIGNRMNGVDTATANLSDLYDTVDRIIDGVDFAGKGLVRIKADNVYVTKESYFPPLGSSASDVQRGVDTAAVNDLIHVKSGDYNVTNNSNNGVVRVSKNLTITGDGVVTTSVRAFVLNNGSNITNWGNISATNNVTIQSGAIISNATTTPTLVSLIDSNGSLIFESGASFNTQLNVVNKNLNITSSTPASPATLNTIGSGSANTAISLSGTGNVSLTDLTIGGTGTALIANHTGSFTINRLSLNSNLTMTNGVVGTISNAGVFGYNGQDQDLTYKLNSTGFSTSLFNHQFLSFSPSGNTVFNGGNANDSFLIDRIMLNTTLNGGAGNDAFSLGTTMATSNSSSMAFIDGNSGDNTLNAPVGQNNQFSLTSSGSGSLNTIPQTNFQNIQNISGGIANDVITITRGMVFSSISGGGGYDTLQVQSDAGDTVNMNISGYNSGSISGTSGISIGAFSGFANLIGSAGNDTFGFVNNSGILTGTIDGGSGTNSISYVGTTKPVYVNLATGQATGVTSTTNTGVVSNIQDLFGGTGNDYFIGSSAANVMDGGSGDDTLMGQGGNDILVGNYGADQINGGAGYDILIGGLINFVTSGMPNATLQAGLQTIMTSWKAVANDAMFNTLSSTLNTASSTQSRLVGDISNTSTYMFQTVFNDQAVDRLTDIASSTVPNWFFATERVTSGNDIVLAGTTFTVSKKTVSSKSARSLR